MLPGTIISKPRIEQVLERLKKGEAIEPRRAGRWDGHDLVELASVIAYTLFRRGPSHYTNSNIPWPGRLKPVRLHTCVWGWWWRNVVAAVAGSAGICRDVASMQMDSSAVGLRYFAAAEDELPHVLGHIKDHACDSRSESLFSDLKAQGRWWGIAVHYRAMNVWPILGTLREGSAVGPEAFGGWTTWRMLEVAGACYFMAAVAGNSHHPQIKRLSFDYVESPISTLMQCIVQRILEVRKGTWVQLYGDRSILRFRPRERTEVDRQCPLNPGQRLSSQDMEELAEIDRVTGGGLGLNLEEVS